MSKENYDKVVQYLQRRVDDGKIQQNTLKTYVKHIRELNKAIDSEQETIDFDYFKKNVDKIVKYYDSTNVNIQNNFKTLLMVYSILDKNIPKDLIKLNYKFKDQTNLASSLAPKKSLKFTNFDQVKEVFNEWYNIAYTKKGKFNQLGYNDLVKFIAISFYSLLPPMRPNELIGLKLFEYKPKGDKDLGNYLDLDTKKMYFTKYKTSGTYGSLILDVPDELVKILKDSLPHIHESPDGYKYPFTRSSGNQIKISNFPSWFSTIDGLKGSSATDLRNLYVSSLPSDITQEQRGLIAKYMKNSISNQQLIYSKYNKNYYPDASKGKSKGDSESESESDGDSETDKLPNFRSHNNSPVKNDELSDEIEKLKTLKSELESERQKLIDDKLKFEQEKAKLNKPKRKYVRKNLKA